MEKELAPRQMTVSKPTKASPKKARGGGLAVKRYFTTPGVDPADEMPWELRSAGIQGIRPFS